MAKKATKAFDENYDEIKKMKESENVTDNDLQDAIENLILEELLSRG